MSPYQRPIGQVEISFRVARQTLLIRMYHRPVPHGWRYVRIHLGRRIRDQYSIAPGCRQTNPKVRFWKNDDAPPSIRLCQLIVPW
jgi:hypothetical protein